MKQYTIERIEKEGMIVFSAIMGSHAYGTNLPTSDTDIRGIFIQPLEDILGFGKVDQVADEKNDIIYYEIGRFLDLHADSQDRLLVGKMKDNGSHFNSCSRNGFKAKHL